MTAVHATPNPPLLGEALEGLCHFPKNDRQSDRPPNHKLQINVLRTSLMPAKNPET